jgi:hypothetical protein
MKHILNNLSDEEKNSILEQHTGGMKVMNENFSKLLNSKLGDAKPLVSEQSKGNQFKEQIANLIDEISSSMSWDMWRDTDDLMNIYKKLLPLKGKKVGAGEIPRYREMDSEEMNPNMPALHYFNTMYSRIPKNKYGMGDGPKGYFTSRLSQVGDKTFSGEVEKTSDSKYTTQQVKKMIKDLINNG